jgi:hypothetical protein
MGPITLDKQFFDYLHTLEHALVYRRDLWRAQEVSKKDCKLSRQQFGQILGNSFECDFNCVIDYFGLLRKSTGFLREALCYTDTSVPTNILYFQSIKIETVLSVSPALVQYFPVCKEKILSIRGFNTP